MIDEHRVPTIKLDPAPISKASEIAQRHGWTEVEFWRRLAVNADMRRQRNIPMDDPVAIIISNIPLGQLTGDDDPRFRQDAAA